MLDPLTQQLGIGGAVAVVLVATVMKFLPAFMAALKSQNGKNGSAGQKDPSYWTLEFGRIINEKLKEHESKVREIIRQELDNRR
jgi:hypothetical protein